MFKKLTLLLAAVAVLAFAVPSLASASKATLPAGTLAPVGTQFTTTGSDIIFTSSLLGNITCSTLNLNGSLTKNNGTTVEASGTTSAPTQSGCKNGEKTVTITSVEVTNLTTTTSGSGTWSYKMAVDIGSLSCTYTGTKVPFTFTSGTNVMNFSSASGITGSPAGCGTTKLTGAFALEKAGTSTSLILD
jgi:hypothetical protein